ncbi:hypothetical protein PR202_gb08232 [Eleusine coracana subsp. coracana]|uniref:Uncharacterized protein n=1 Tax=Eleusine coracana subsp. coracana TaxID=191504 RepID=A0AAV5EE67_ELECO|nr:hypothetical protein QOZ80_2BG0182790 [Eleusine coracana subsp. coracana]GJN20809.1 hypothetical protein PR202_gb08232 [Eleusine coracana subsp. coracana]
MASSSPLLGLYSGSRRRVQATSSGAGVRRPAVPVKELLMRLRSTWRRSVARPRKKAAVSFMYDLHSYSLNFDDGVVGSGNRHVEIWASAS